jgi:hypothetical protein
MAEKKATTPEAVELLDEFRTAYEAFVAAACKEPDYDHEAYEAAAAEAKRLAVRVYGEVMAEAWEEEWMPECHDYVPSVGEMREWMLRRLLPALDEAATHAAHGTDMVYMGPCTKESKDAVAERFREVVRLLDRIEAVGGFEAPRPSRETRLMLALRNAMKEKAADYGVNLA